MFACVEKGDGERERGVRFTHTHRDTYTDTHTDSHTQADTLTHAHT